MDILIFDGDLLKLRLAYNDVLYIHFGWEDKE